MTAEEILVHARALMLDFDGPICSVFAGIPASTVANQLRDVLADGGHTDLPEAVATSADPFDVFRYAATLGEEEARYVEAAFAAHDVEAISSAAPTDGAHELIEAWHESGRPLAVVSNNGVPAISTYLDFYSLRSSINYISARTGPDVPSRNRALIFYVRPRLRSKFRQASAYLSAIHSPTWRPPKQQASSQSATPTSRASTRNSPQLGLAPLLRRLQT